MNGSGLFEREKPSLSLRRRWMSGRSAAGSILTMNLIVRPSSRGTNTTGCDFGFATASGASCSAGDTAIWRLTDRRTSGERKWFATLWAGVRESASIATIASIQSTPSRVLAAERRADRERSRIYLFETNPRETFAQVSRILERDSRREHPGIVTPNLL